MFVFFVKQKTAYEMRISDWSSDVCSSDLIAAWQRRWYGLALAWLVCVAGWLAVERIPDRYQSSAQVNIDTTSMLRPLMAGIAADLSAGRSEERREGKECGSTCRSRWSPYHYKKKRQDKKIRTDKHS